MAVGTTSEKRSLSLSLSRATGQVRSRKAFTLVELMIVIAIIGVLAASLFPMMSGYMERAKDTKSRLNLKNLSQILEIYKADKGRYPSTTGLLGNAHYYRNTGDPYNFYTSMMPDYIHPSKKDIYFIEPGIGSWYDSRMMVYGSCLGGAGFALWGRVAYPTPEETATLSAVQTGACVMELVVNDPSSWGYNAMTTVGKRNIVIVK